MSPPAETLPEGTDAIIPGAATDGGFSDGFASGQNRGSSMTPPTGPKSAGPKAASGSLDDVAAQAGNIKESATKVIGDKAAGLREQATDQARAFALQGKDRTTDALDNVVQMIEEAASQVDDKVGAQYGDYVRRASSTVSDFADQLRDKDVDELVTDARDLVRGNAALAIGVAAAVGFLAARVAKVGLAPAETVPGSGPTSPDAGTA